MPKYANIHQNIPNMPKCKKNWFASIENFVSPKAASPQLKFAKKQIRLNQVLPFDIFRPDHQDDWVNK